MLRGVPYLAGSASLVRLAPLPLVRVGDVKLGAEVADVKRIRAGNVVGCGEPTEEVNIRGSASNDIHGESEKNIGSYVHFPVFPLCYTLLSLGFPLALPQTDTQSLTAPYNEMKVNKSNGEMAVGRGRMNFF